MKKITSIKDISIGDELICNPEHGKFFKYKVTGIDTKNKTVDVTCICIADNKKRESFESCGIDCFSHILNKDEKKPSVGTLQNMVKNRDNKIATLEKELKEYKDAIFQVRNILP